MEIETKTKILVTQEDIEKLVLSHIVKVYGEKYIIPLDVSMYDWKAGEINLQDICGDSVLLRFDVEERK